MIAVLSPSKTLRELKPEVTTTEPIFQKEANRLALILKKETVNGLSELMHLSEKLAILNYDRFQSYKKAPAYPAGWLYWGDVFHGLAIDDFTEEEVQFAKDHLRVLSGLYGLLRITDNIVPYRLEMSTKVANKEGKDLYAFWGNKLKKQLEKELGQDVLINLASKEYSRALKLSEFKGPVLEVDFLELRGKKTVNIPLFSKKARGLMARYLVKTKAKTKEDLQGFDLEGYRFSKELSGELHYVFVRS